MPTISGHMRFTRRFVNPAFDSEPSYHHIFNYKISKKYIKRKRVLDVGCWTGQFEKLAVGVVQEIVGVDPNPKAIDFAKKNLPGVKFFQARAEKLPFENESFDAVAFLEVIEHLPKGLENSVLNEINRVLKPGGYLILSTPNDNFISVLFDPAYFLLGHRHYSLKHLNQLLSLAGFLIVKEYKTGGMGRLLFSNIELVNKHFLKGRINFYRLFAKRIEREYDGVGFAQNHIIALKTAEICLNR